MSIEFSNENDVILGRGTGPCRFVGNEKFRQLVDDRKKVYVASRNNRDKGLIAYEVVRKVHSLGENFVKQVSKGRKREGVVVGARWE